MFWLLLFIAFYFAELHMQRLKNLRHLSEKLKDDAWMYPELESTLGI